MADLPTMIPAEVPSTLVKAAEQALAAHAADNPDADLSIPEAIRIMLAEVLPAHTRQLAKELRQLPVLARCPVHGPPATDTDCSSCQHAAGVRDACHVLESRQTVSSFMRQWLNELAGSHG